MGKANTEVSEDEVRKQYIELQLLGRQIKQAQEQVEALDEHLVALSKLVQDLETLKSMRPDTEMLSALSSGIFVRSILKDCSEVVVNVGADVAVVKSVDDAKAFVKGKLDEAQSHRAGMLEELERMVQQARQAEESMASLVG
ncbi:prefoldin subunit alpha [Candidatus Woesearchaeota archaeon]|nr:prefoldin subunit alpha [Candidatus Woesearchaeota archaeon]